MVLRLALALLGALWTLPAPPRAATNDNRAPAGRLRDRVLTIALEAREAEWHPDRDDAPGVVVRAFAERGHPASVPGPLLRVPEGTEIRATITNALATGTLVVHGLSTRGGAQDAAADTIQLAPGATREVRFVAGVPGTYYYWGTTGTARDVGARSSPESQLGGAFVVDPATSPPRGGAAVVDRVFVLSLWRADTAASGIVQRDDLLRFAINGKAWPNTERLAYDAGDSVRFHLVNVSAAPHPMHLHGFYFAIDARGDGTHDSVYAASARPRVVTERLATGRTFTMSWVPERVGNWLFHCHDNYHVLRNAPLDGTPLPAEHLAHVRNHTTEMMGGLVMAVAVRPAPARLAAAPSGTGQRRALRLVARVDSGSTASEPAYGYVLQDGARSVPDHGPLLPGPTILLARGEPVSITVVNALAEPTAVHWHGIELESYYDGVADFSGVGTHTAPAIAPGDSFVARFTPPRSGTFMYHPHADEVRQQQAGMSGAIVVVDDPARYDAVHDIVMLVSVPRRDADARRGVLLNGSATPAPRDLRVGERYRLRLADIHTFRPSMIARLLRDTSLVTWRALAKDGMDLPSARATVRPAVQQIANGETYDFELVPDAPGDLRLTIASATGQPLAQQVFRVR